MCTVMRVTPQACVSEGSYVSTGAKHLLTSYPIRAGSGSRSQYMMSQTQPSLVQVRAHMVAVQVINRQSLPTNLYQALLAR